MATEKIRIVGYLPEPYHQQLRKYMQEHSLTESAALVQIIKHFFEGSQGTVDFQSTITTLQTELSQVQRRLGVIEEAIANGKYRQTQGVKASASTAVKSPVHALSNTDLAKRLGVSPDMILAEAFKGDAHFRAWSKRRDPSAKPWSRQGDLFHPLSD